MTPIAPSQIDDETQTGFDLIPDHPMTKISPSQMIRELRIKTALARLLPDEIEITGLNNFQWRRWPHIGDTIHDHEWDYIVSHARRKVGHFFVPKWDTLAIEFLAFQNIEW